MSYINLIFFPQEYINIYYYYNTTSVILYENQNVLHVAKLSSFQQIIYISVKLYLKRDV